MIKQSARSLARAQRRQVIASIAASALLLPVLPSIAAAPAAQPDTAVTIYSSARPGAIPPEYYRPLPGQGTPNAMGVPGYAMVRQERPVELSRGQSEVRFTDVAALIDPTTVTFTSLTDPAARVLEQNFQFDLVSTDKLLLKFIDQPLTVERALPGGAIATTSGTLLSSVDGLVLRGEDGTITALRDYSALRFPDSSSAMLIVRGRELVAPRGHTKLEAGDHLYVFCKPEERDALEDMLLVHRDHAQET